MKKGFIIIQIDGLPYNVFKKAIKRGYVPFLKDLIKNKRLSIHKMCCGLPATTARTQLGIMYGDNGNIPGHMWFEKESLRFFITCSSYDAKYIETKMSNGILKGGGSFGNLFSGGAKKSCSLFAMNDELQSLFKLFPKIKMITHLLIGFFILPFDIMISLIGSFRPGALLGTLFSAFIFSGYKTDLAIEEIKKGSPYLYVNFFGYDSSAHNFGCESIWSMLALRAIDRGIRKINKARGKNGSLDYDLFIISDHGQIESISFVKYFQETLREVIKRSLENQEISVIEGERLKFRAVLNQAEYIVANISWLRILRGVSRIIVKRYRKMVQIAPSTKESVVLVPSGDIVHVYFNVRKRKMLYEEIEKIYPRFLNNLLNHKSIQFLALSSMKGPIILDRNGKTILLGIDNNLIKEDFSFSTVDYNFLADSVRELIEMGNSGDVILFGTKIEGKPITFSSGIKGSHGGIYKDEQEIFILSPPIHKYPLEQIKNPKELYPFFMKYRNL